MERVDDLEAFLAIVERGSQTAAAKQLKRSLQSIGRSLALLEQSVGVELIRRSTRSSQPTEAGLSLYHRIKPALLEIQDAKRDVASRRGEPVGLLRIAAPVRFASAFVVPTVSDFLARYPGVEVELKTSDRRVDVYDERIDLAVRIRALPDSALRARRLGALRVVVFAAPTYLARHGRPRHPAELANHPCVVRSADADGDQWSFRVRGKREVVHVNGRFRSDDAVAIQEAVTCGLGFGIAPAWQIRSLLEKGAVEVVLAEFEPPSIPVVAVSPATKVPQAKTRLFTDMLSARLKHEEL
jgi:DNA-binding transcriptional LysR family regulator